MLKRGYLWFTAFLIAGQAVILPGSLFSWVLFKFTLFSWVCIFASWFVLNRKERDNVLGFVGRALEGELWVQLSRIPVSKRSIEFFAVLYVVLVFMAAYFAEAIPKIMSFYRAMYGSD